MNPLCNLKVYYRYLLKNKLYTIINILGLSISLMFIIVITIYVIQEFSIDKFQTKAERIYIVGSEQMPATGAAIAYKLKDRYPEIEKVCPSVINNFNVMPVSTPDQKLSAKLMFTDSTFLDIFSFKLLEGNLTQLLIAKDEAIISESFARKLSNPQEIIGRRLQIGDSTNVIIGGIIENIKHSAIPECDIILPWRLVKNFNPTLEENMLDNSGGTVAFVLARPNSSFHSKADDIKEWFKTFFWPYQRGISKEVRIESLKDFYMSGWGDGYPLNRGNRKFVLIFMSIGFLILIFAVLNYINLTIAQSASRFREISIRRLLGSCKKEIFIRFIVESMMVIILSMIIGVLLAIICKPFANDLLNMQLDYNFLFSFTGVSRIFVLILLVGCISGLLPAFVISSVSPINILRGSFGRNTKMILGKTFIIVQFFITVVMLASSLIIKMQIDHLLNAPLGFNTSNLYEINVMDVNDRQLINTFCNELRSVSNIEKVGITQGVPTSGSNNITIQYNDNNERKNISFQQYVMDEECFDLLGLKILSDNKITGNGWFVNKEAMNQMNLPEDAPYFSVGNGRVNIAGIVSEFHEKNILGHISPILFRYLKPEDTGWSVIVKIQGNIFETTKTISNIYNKVIGSDINASFLDEQIENSFKDQIRLYKMIIVFTVIAIIIAFLGLIAMASYFVRKKTKEVALRKIFGSTNGEVFIYLVRQFLFYVLIAFVFAVPVAYYFMNNWLLSYSYRIDLHWAMFVIVGIVCVLISFLAVFLQCKRAANKNPIDSISIE